MTRATWLAVGAVAGSWYAATVHPPPAALALATAAACIAAFACWSAPSEGFAREAGLGAAVGGGLLLVRCLMGAPAVGVVTVLPDGDGPWTVTVESVGSPRDGAQTAIGRIEPDGTRVALTVPRYPVVEPGHRAEVAGRLRPPPDGGYGEYLRRIGVAGTLRSRNLEIVGERDGPTRALEALRRATGNALAAALPEPEAGLAAGILVGLRDRVDRDLAADFTTAGVSHVVAISGWNIAIVAAAVGALGGSLARRRRTVLILTAIGVYVAFAGASPSVVRAGAMATVVLLARESGRRGRAASALAWAVSLLLLADPALVLDAGFQLSAVATGGLLAWASPLQARIGTWFGGRLPGWIVENLAVSFAAQAATLPIVLAAFGRLALVSPLINLGVVPLVVPAMAGGGVALAAGVLGWLGAPAGIVAFLALPGWLALTAMVNLVTFAAAVPFASLTLPPEASPLLGAATALLVAAIAVGPRGRRTDDGERRPGSVPGTSPPAASRGPGRRVRGAVAVLLMITVSIPIVAAARGPGGAARVTVLDVGQGDAVLVEGSNGGRLLVDGGPNPDRLLRVLDERLPPWDRRLDVVVVSHPHEDHVAGLALLLERYQVRHILEPGMRGPGPGYAALVDVLARPGSPELGLIAAGDRLRVDDVTLDVLWPDAGTVPLEPPDTGTGINNVSVVLRGEAGGHSFLLMGDVEEGVDPALIGRGMSPVDFLKVAHHGSATATTRAFLEAADPAVAVASAGAGNPYGHPARGTIERLVATGAAVYRTDIDGSVSVTFGRTIEVEASGGRGAVERLEAPADTVQATATTDAATAQAAWAVEFACGVPGPSPTAPRSATRPRATNGASNAAADLSADHAERRRWPGTLVGYDDDDDGPRSDGRRGPPPLPRPASVAPAALARRGRDRRLAGGTDRGTGNFGGPPARRGGRAPPRRGQAPSRG